MKLIRMVSWRSAVLLPASWTLAHAGDDMKDSGGDMKEGQQEEKEGGQGRQGGHGRREEGGHGEEVVFRSIASVPRLRPAPRPGGRRRRDGGRFRKGERARERSQPPTSSGRPRHPLGERGRADDHGRQRAADLQRVPGVRAQGRDASAAIRSRGTRSRSWLTFGGWLAGARNWHFAMMWVLVANGLVYLGFIYLHGEWRDLVPRRGDLPRRLGDGEVLPLRAARSSRTRASTTRSSGAPTSRCRSSASLVVLAGSRSGSRCSSRR